MGEYWRCCLSSPLWRGFWRIPKGERRRAGQRIDNLERELDRLRKENETLREELSRLKAQRAGGQDVTVYFVFSGEREFSLVPEVRQVPGGNLPLEALRELAKGPSAGSGLNRSLPEGTRVLGLEVKRWHRLCGLQPGNRGEFQLGSKP